MFKRFHPVSGSRAFGKCANDGAVCPFDRDSIAWHGDLDPHALAFADEWLNDAELIEEVAIEIGDGFEADFASVDLAERIVSLIAERLADVTPEMVEAWADTGLGDCPTEIEAATADWRAMLSASALGNGGKP